MHFTTRTAGFSWLLPQPGGFECISFVEELAEAHDHPVPDREQLVIEPANFRTAPGPRPTSIPAISTSSPPRSTMRSILKLYSSKLSSHRSRPRGDQERPR